MNRLVLSLYFVVMCTVLHAASETGIELQNVHVNIKDKASLQRGAKLYMNYCSGCHSLKYMRYNTMAKGLGLTTFDGDVDKDLLYNNLIFTTAKHHAPIEIAMPDADAREWFGIQPPDLSLIARKRSPNWLFTYLNSFYADDKRPFGANNLLIPGVAMPNVLAPLQGKVIAVRKNSDHSEGNINYLLMTKKGTMTQHQFDQALTDIVNFLVYVGEPAKLIRYRIGFWVIAFLFILLIFSYRLKKAYWKKLH